MTADEGQRKRRRRQARSSHLILASMLAMMAACGDAPPPQSTSPAPDPAAVTPPAPATDTSPQPDPTPPTTARDGAPVARPGVVAKSVRPGAPRPPAPPPDGQALKREVSYNQPRELRFGEAVQVKVVLRAPATAVSGSFRGLPGQVTTAPIEVREEATAVLEGPADRVKIVRRQGFPAWQSATAGNPTWMWDVTATAPGSANLDLTVKTKADGAPTETVVESYHAVIPVRMGWVDAVKWWIGQVDPIWKWLVGVAGALGAAFVWFRTQFGRKPSAT